MKLFTKLNKTLKKLTGFGEILGLDVHFFINSLINQQQESNDNDRRVFKALIDLCVKSLAIVQM